MKQKQPTLIVLHHYYGMFSPGSHICGYCSFDSKTTDGREIQISLPFLIFKLLCLLYTLHLFDTEPTTINITKFSAPMVT